MQALQSICQFPANLLIIQLPCTPLGNYVVIGNIKLLFMEPIEFSYQAPDPVSADCIPHLAADGNPNFSQVGRARAEDNEVGGVDLLSRIGKMKK